MARTLLRVPATAARGEVVEIRTLIQHPMETGFRSGENGRMLPRDIIRRFNCLYNGASGLRGRAASGDRRQPLSGLHASVAEESGILAFTWEGDNGFSQTETRALTVT